ncbi:MAG: type II toxin-antitoxin system VapC family toxin [Candidatus Sumerlaeia bacterium]
MIYDTDILVWTLRGNEKAAAVIDADPQRHASIVSHMELIQGARNKRELAAIRRFMTAFQVLPLSEEIGFRARIYMEQHSIGNSLGLADALIAATAIEIQSQLCTANIRHYRVIPDLELKSFRP